MPFPSLPATVNLAVVSACSQIALRRRHHAKLAKLRLQDHISRHSLLPPKLARLVTLALQSASLLVKKGFELGALAIEAVKHGVISSLEMCRDITHDSVARVTRDIAVHSDSTQARAYAEAASHGVATDLHGVFDDFVFWFVVGCDLAGSTAALLGNVTQLILFGIDQVFGYNNTSSAVVSVLCMMNREFSEPPMAAPGESIGSADMFVAFSSLAYIRAACRRLLTAENRRDRVERTVWDAVVRDACPPVHPREHALFHGQGGRGDACLRKPRCLDFRPTPRCAAELDLNLGTTVVNMGYEPASAQFRIPHRRSTRLSILQHLVARSTLALPKGSLSILLRNILPHGDIEASSRHPQVLPDATHEWLPTRHSVPDLRQLSSMLGTPGFSVALEVTDIIGGAQHAPKQSLLTLHNDGFDSAVPGHENAGDVDSPLTINASGRQHRRLPLSTAVVGCSYLRQGQRGSAGLVETVTEQPNRFSRPSSGCCSSIVQITPKAPQSSVATPAPSTALIDRRHSEPYDLLSSLPKALDALRQRGELRGMYPNRHFLANAVRYMRFASATYGCVFLRMLGIETAMPARTILDDTPMELRAYTHHTRSDPGSILLCSFVDSQGGSDVSGEVNTGMPLVHYISLDHDSKAVVLACRGTLGFEDVLADMACEYDDLDWQGRSYKVHKGVHASAQRLLYGGDGKVLQIIEGALKAHPEYGLVLTGHSLGAAVTSLLGIMLAVPTCSADTPFITSPEPHTEYRKFAERHLRPPAHECLPSGRPIHVFAFGPPSTVCTPLREATRGLITTVVNDTDLVPYLSLGALHDVQAAALILRRKHSAGTSDGAASVAAPLTSPETEPQATLRTTLSTLSEAGRPPAEEVAPGETIPTPAAETDPQTAVQAASDAASLFAPQHALQTTSRTSHSTFSEAAPFIDLTFGKDVIPHMKRSLVNAAARHVRRNSGGRTASGTASRTTSTGTSTSTSITTPTDISSTNKIPGSGPGTCTGSSPKSNIHTSSTAIDDSTTENDSDETDSDSDAAGQEEAQWAYSALQALRTRMTSEKLVPPGEVFIMETKEVRPGRGGQRSGGSGGVCGGVKVKTCSASGLGSGSASGFPSEFATEKRMVLKYVCDVPRRFGELRFGPSMMLDHNPAKYEASLESLMAGVGVTEEG